MKNTNLKSRIRLFSIVLGLLGGLFFTSCSNDDLDTQTDFPFEVNVMPVPKEIANRQTVEMRFTIKPQGNYQGTNYFIRYFQFDGQGDLRLFNDAPFQPNDLYPLPGEQFRLYYTSRSSVVESFDVWISDNSGHEQKLSFRFNNKDTRTIIGN